MQDNSRNHSMEEHATDKRYFIPVDGTLIEVSEDVYRAYYQPIWNTRYHARKNGECICTRAQLWKCDGICPGCPFYAAGKKLSIDAPIGGEDNEFTLSDTLTDDAPNIESIVCDKAELDHLFARLNQLMPEAVEIGKLRLAGLNDGAIADILGIKRTTFRSRLQKAKEKLADEYPDYF